MKRFVILILHKTSLFNTEHREKYIEAVTKLPGWKLTHEGKRIRKDWNMKDFPAALKFFEKVGEKVPPWGKTLILYKVMNSKDYFTTGKLSSITELEDGFRYMFTDDQDGITDAHEFSYYLVPTLP